MVLVGVPDSTRLAECCHLQMFSPENLFKLFQHLHLYILIVSELRDTLHLVARTRLQKSKCSWQAVMTRKHSISVLFIMAKFTTVFTVYSRLKTLQYRREMPDDQISKNSLFTGGGLWQTQDSGLEKEALRNKSIVSDNSFCDECN